MNIRKFYFIISSMVSLFLFVIGITILSYIVKDDSGSQQAFGSILNLDEHRTDTKPFNVLFMVADKEEYNTDTMLLLNYDPGKAKINVLSLPRDTRVKFKGYYVPKLNSVYSNGGLKKACETVSNLLDVNIKYYVYINLKTFRDTIDTLGGVDYNVPVDIDYDDPSQDLHIHIKKGMHHMDGKMAEEFLRYRHPNGSYSKELLKYYDGSDIKRTDMQLSFVKELVRQKAKLYNITKINSVLNVVFKNMKTNITLSEVLGLSTSVTKLKASSLQTFRLDGEDGIVGEIWYFLYNGRIMNLSTKKSNDTQLVINKYFMSEPGISKSEISDTARHEMYDFEAPSPSPIKVSPKPVVSPSPSPLPTPTFDPWADWEENPSNTGSVIKPDPSGEG